jgi:hypothetical protein
MFLLDKLTPPDRRAHARCRMTEVEQSYSDRYDLLANLHTCSQYMVKLFHKMLEFSFQGQSKMMHVLKSTF